jgi:hypothetical protein
MKRADRIAGFFDNGRRPGGFPGGIGRQNFPFPGPDPDFPPDTPPCGETLFL